MLNSTISVLLDLNHQFYQNFAGAFAATRRRIQPGVRRVLPKLPAGGRLLDLGCGSGALALEIDRLWVTGSYLGLDFSVELLAEARQALRTAGPGGVDIRFARADLSDPAWTDLAAAQPVDAVLAFAVLHHMPGSQNRLRLLRQVNGLLPLSGIFIHSEWQFQHSPKLMARRQPWSRVGLAREDLEPGDTLLDWRQAEPGGTEQTGLRYVHLFNEEELSHLAAEAGFEILETFSSDGEGGRLGLYQVWIKIEHL
jgi:SAM-dependent methyltransferase